MESNRERNPAIRRAERQPYPLPSERNTCGNCRRGPVLHRQGAPPNPVPTGTLILHLPTPRKPGYMREHVERSSRPTPAASTGATGKKFPFSSSSQLLEKIEPQAGCPASGFHRRAVGTDCSRGVGHPEPGHQVGSVVQDAHGRWRCQTGKPTTKKWPHPRRIDNFLVTKRWRGTLVLRHGR
jgi:hypothetical protein